MEGVAGPRLERLCLSMEMSQKRCGVGDRQAEGKTDPKLGDLTVNRRDTEDGDMQNLLFFLWVNGDVGIKRRGPLWKSIGRRREDSDS